jgi:hypothetical protein
MMPECALVEGVCAGEKHGESDNIGNGEPVQEMDHNVDHPDRCLQVNMALGFASSSFTLSHVSIGALVCSFTSWPCMRSK